MERVRLWYSEECVQPKVLLNHFFRYIGVYIENMPNNKTDRLGDVLADICICEDVLQFNYYRERAKRNTIIIDCSLSEYEYDLRDFWYEQERDERIGGIIPFRIEMDNYVFLNRLVESLTFIVDDSEFFLDLLITDIENFHKNVKKISQIYLRNDILEAALFSRCFEKDDELFEFATEKYLNFITELEELREDCSDLNKLVAFAIVYAQFEYNLICRANDFECYYSIERMIGEINEIASLYENEQLYILLADIAYELEGRWVKAANLFGEECLELCAYSRFKRGKIFLENDYDYDMAIYELQRAIQLKRDYYTAYFYLARCQEIMMNYSEAIHYYEMVTNVLQKHFLDKSLSPMEYSYYLESVICISNIYKYWLEDSRKVEYYEIMIKKIIKYSCCEDYLRIMKVNGFLAKDTEKIVRMYV